MQILSIQNYILNTLTRPFKFQNSKIYYLNNFSCSFKNSFPDSLTNNFLLAIEKQKNEFVDISRKQKNDFEHIKEVLHFLQPELIGSIIDNTNSFISTLSYFRELLQIKEHSDHAFIVPIDDRHHIYLFRNTEELNEENLNIIIDDIIKTSINKYVYQAEREYSINIFDQESFHPYHLFLDEKAKNKINDIEYKLKELSNSGAFLQALPFFVSRSKNFKKRDEIKISKLGISEDLSISRSDHEVVEVKTGPQTKSSSSLFIFRQDFSFYQLIIDEDEFCI